jgi:hypothetical protein
MSSDNNTSNKTPAPVPAPAERPKPNPDAKQPTYEYAMESYTPPKTK